MEDPLIIVDTFEPGTEPRLIGKPYDKPMTDEVARRIDEAIAKVTANTKP